MRDEARMSVRDKISVFALVAVFVMGMPVMAATRTWDGDGTDNLASTPANWSEDTVPTSSDDVLYDATSTKDCDVDLVLTVRSITMAAAYTGTVTLLEDLTITPSGMTLGGGTFQAEAQTLSIRGDVDFSAGGTFDSGTSRVRFTNGDATLTPGGDAFYDMEIAKGYTTYKLYVAGVPAVVTNHLLLTKGKLYAGTVHLEGDVTVADDVPAANGAVVFTGAGAQSITCAAAGMLPNVEVNKPSGTLSYATDVNVSRNYTHTFGDVDPGTYCLAFVGNLNVTFTPGRIDYYDLELAKNSSVNNVEILTATARVSNDLMLTRGNLLAGTIKVFGDVSVTTAEFAGGAGTVSFQGWEAQSVSCAAGSRLPSVEVALFPGTVLSYTSDITADRDYVHVSGVLDAGTYELELAGLAGVFTPGNETYYDLKLNKNSASGNVTVTDVADIANDLTLANGKLQSGTLQVAGNVLVTEPFGGSGEGTVLFF